MRHTNSPLRVRRSTSTQRAELLAAFDRSGLSAAAFARKHQLNYTTFCGWRHRRDRVKPAAPAFLEVEVAPPDAPAELLIELGSSARLRIRCASQMELAARLIQTFNASAAC
jgi:hypothetical protein